MKRRPLLRFGRGDFLAAALVLVLAAACALAFVPERASEQAAAVQIYLDGELIAQLPLDTDAQYTVNGRYRNIVSVRNGTVTIAETDCPGADCMHSGGISAPGRSIVCLPNKCEVRIVGTGSDVDFVVR